ncbi:putative tetrahydrofolate dehydrogenase/cyclohydrolase [Plasmopara halstedii]
MLANDGADVYSATLIHFIFRRGKLFQVMNSRDSMQESRVIITGVRVVEIKGVQYVPLVGKVTVAMLERNLLRLYENFHWNQRKSGINV